MNDAAILDAPYRGADIKIHGPAGFEGMRTAGKLAAECLDMLTAHVVPGVETQYLDDLARNFILERGALPACLFYMADVDAPLHRHLRDLTGAFGPGADRLFGHCADYPREPSPGTRLAWLLERLVAPAAIYVHRVGRSVGQVHDEHHLREAVESYVDPPGTIPAQLTATEAHGDGRSEERRVGKECPSKCRSRWSPYH